MKHIFIFNSRSPPARHASDMASFGTTPPLQLTAAFRTAAMDAAAVVATGELELLHNSCSSS
jgi:hypothetical protein